VSDVRLDNPAWSSLLGEHSALGRRKGRAARYAAEVSVLGAVDGADRESLADLAALADAGDVVAVGGDGPAIEASLEKLWEIVGRLVLNQLVLREGPEAPPRDSGAEILPLSSADSADMLELASRTEPGPFGARTGEMGRYIGVRESGKLVAMAGERMAPPGFRELSAVCTDPSQRGRGLAEHLCAEILAGIAARGETAFLHVAEGGPSQRTATALYERLGFRYRQSRELLILRRI